MTAKIISLATVIVTLDVYLQSLFHTNGLLPLFINTNLVFNTVLLLIVLAALTISFKRRFRRFWSFGLCALAAFGLGVFSIDGFLAVGIDFDSLLSIQPLDFLLLIEAAMILGLAALTLPHPAIKASWRPSHYFHVPPPASFGRLVPGRPQLAQPLQAVSHLFSSAS